MACAQALPDSAEILNPARHYLVEIVTNNQPEAEEDDDNKSLFPNLYADIDNRALGSDYEMPEAENTTHESYQPPCRHETITRPNHYQ